MQKDIIKLCGLYRDEISERLERFRDSGLEFAISEKCADATVTMKSSQLDKMAFERAKSEVYATFADETYSSLDISLKDLAAKLLDINHRVLSVAESFTGGEICSELISTPGISKHFFEGAVVYNSQAKIRRLGVREDTLRLYGAISSQTAREMAAGLLRFPPADLALATTGLAGPDPDEGKPVGLVYIAVGSPQFITVFERQLSGSRNEIRQAGVNLALFYLIRFLRGDILML